MVFVFPNSRVSHRLFSLQPVYEQKEYWRWYKRHKIRNDFFFVSRCRSSCINPGYIGISSKMESRGKLCCKCARNGRSAFVGQICVTLLFRSSQQQLFTTAAPYCWRANKKSIPITLLAFVLLLVRRYIFFLLGRNNISIRVCLLKKPRSR